MGESVIEKPRDSTVSSKRPGAGRTHRKPTTTPDPPTPATRTTVLIADDEPDIRGLVRIMLKEKGITTLAAADGDEALTLLREDRPGLGAVFLDLTIPTKNPDTLFAEISHMCKLTSTPVVLMSGYSVRDAREATKGHTFAGFLQKPFQPSALYAQLTELHILDA
jgi:CheY-like chemotaxis protein